MNFDDREEPARPLPGDEAGDPPTAPLRDDEPGDAPTEPLPERPEDEPTLPLADRPEDEPTQPLADRAAEPTEPMPGAPGAAPDRDSGQPDRAGDGRRLGFLVLAGSILAAVALCGAYIGLGGLDYRPAGGTDPCAPRAWGSPKGLEQTAERFSLAAIDGAACELGVSREELTRALAGDESRDEFAADHGLSDSEIEDAVRAGLLRATDDAERGGSLSPVAATGARLALRVMPMSLMVALIDNASDLFTSGLGSGIGGVLGDALGLLGPGSGSGDSAGGESGEDGGTGSGSPSLEELPGRIGGELTDRLREQLPDGVREAVPKDLGSKIEKGLNDLINP